MTVQTWIERHPHLAELALLHAALEGAEAQGQPPRHARSAEELQRGVPLLRSATLDPGVYEVAGRALAAMAEALLQANLPAKVLDEARALRAQLVGSPLEAERLVRAAAESDGAPASLGAFLAWKALSRALGPLDLRGDSRWNHAACPACGAAPAMAQLEPTEHGRERSLVCGRCSARWSYRRIGCPYCENDSLDRLSVLEPDDDPGFRIDVCRDCSGYLKTYTGEAVDPLATADWTTLHLDAACGQRGLRRRGPSLYSI